MAARPLRRDRADAPVTIIIRRDEGEEPVRHGGAWKVAYADFVTAMMAFFMLMWLLNATTEAQRTGIADYFAPTNVFGRSVSGSGQPFGGRTPNDAGSNVSSNGVPRIITGHQSPQMDVDEDITETPARPDAVADTPSDGRATAVAAQAADLGPSGQPARQTALAAAQAAPGRQRIVSGGDYAAAKLSPPPLGTVADDSWRTDAGIRSDAEREEQKLEQTGASLIDAIRNDPALRDAANQIMVESVPKGLRIQIVDAERQPMFALGSTTPTARVRALMQKVVPVLAGLPNAISIAGHTDSLTYRGPENGNWELSTGRANATRRILLEAGMADDRIRSVTGNADRDLLMPAEPLNPANRRITILVLRHAGAETPLGSATQGGAPPIGTAPIGTSPTGAAQ